MLNKGVVTMTQVEVAATIAPKFEATEELLTQLKENAAAIDIIELRIDQRETFVQEALEALTAALHEAHQTAKILVTYRTSSQGGKGEKSETAYYELVEALIKLSGIDMIDIEWEKQNKLRIEQLVKKAQASDIEVVLSQHDFNQTPPLENLKFTYFKMSKTGADYIKLAVMPNAAEDVTHLLDALYISSESVGAKVIGISMSQLGLVSRTAQGVFGGTVSYGALGEAQAPGQIHVSKLKELLTLYDINK